MSQHMEDSVIEAVGHEDRLTLHLDSKERDDLEGDLDSKKKNTNAGKKISKVTPGAGNEQNKKEDQHRATGNTEDILEKKENKRSQPAETDKHEGVDRNHSAVGDRQPATQTANHSPRYRGKGPEGCMKKWSKTKSHWYCSYSGKPPVWEQNVKKLRQFFKEVEEETSETTNQSAQEIAADAIKGMAIDNGDSWHVHNAKEEITGIPEKADRKHSNEKVVGRPHITNEKGVGVDAHKIEVMISHDERSKGNTIGGTYNTPTQKRSSCSRRSEKARHIANHGKVADTSCGIAETSIEKQNQ